MMVVFISLIVLDKVEVSLNAVGRAGKLKLAKVAVKRRDNFQKVISFIRS